MHNIKIVLLILLLVPKYSFAITPTDVYQQVEVVISEIAALKKHSKINEKSRIPGIQVGKAPLHSYAKALELLEKIQRYQVQHQLTPLKLPELPSITVKPTDVMVILKFAGQELERIHKKLNVNVQGEEIATQTTSKTPSDVYEAIWQASYMMDSLVSPIKPADVLRNISMIEQALIQIAKSKRKTLKFPRALSYTTKKPVDVSIQLYKLLYTIARLERQLEIKPLIVPTFPAGKIKPEDAYDVTGNVLADLTRIAVKLNIPAVKRLPIPINKVSPNDVYAQAVRMNAAARQLID
ncbi:MAG: hypothetical protein V7784_15125 [Oceanospirillaceae bacterium]